MANQWDYGSSAPILDDTKVDRIGGDNLPGVIDDLPSLSIDIDDRTIIQNLNNRIQDSQNYWDDSQGFNLTAVRNDNMRQYMNRQQDTRQLYRYQMPYNENQIYVSEQAIKAYLTAQMPQPEVSPAQDTPTSKQFGIDLEKILSAHGYIVHIDRILENCVFNAQNKRAAFVEFEFDPNIGKNGEVMPIVRDPEHCVVDKNARQGENPSFFTIMIKMSVNAMCQKWPDKKEEIYKECSIIRGTYKQLETIVTIRKVYLTYYDKKYEAHEGLVYYFGNTVLEKLKNPNWLYANSNKNFIKTPFKPIIALNFDNDGSHWIDGTSAVEQASPMQNMLNKRGRQLSELADRANGILIVSQDSGLTKDDLQNLTMDPNQRLIIKTAGQNVDNLIKQLDPPQIAPYLYQDKVDLRTQVANIMGTPADFTGMDDQGPESTLGQSIIKKNQASGRMDLYIRCIDRFMHDYFNMLTQMMVVWYNADHYFVYNGGDGQFDHLVANRYLFEDGMAVTVRAGSTPPVDKSRREAIALNLAKQGVLSPLDIYKMLGLQNPQQLYDNWAKYKANPMELARDALDDIDETKAYMAYVEILNGVEPEDPDDCNKEYVLSLRKLMLRDEFLKAPKKIQTKFLKFVNKAIDSLELRTSLDIMSKEGLQLLEPKTPIQPLAPPQMLPAPGGILQNMQPQPMQPQGMPQGLPPAQGQIPGQPPMMPQGMPMPAPSPMNGTPIPNPGSPVMPSPQNPTQLPNL